MNCANDKAGIAQTCEKKYPVQIYKGVLLLVPGFTIPSAEDLADEAAMLGYIADQKIYPIQRMVSVAGEDTEGSVEETATQEKIFNFEGFRGAVYEAVLPLESHKIARTYNDIDWTIIYIDMKGTLVFKENNDGSVQGVGTNLFHVWPMPTPSEVATKTRIQIQERNVEDLDTNGWFLNPTYDALELRGPLDVLASASTIVGNTFTLTVLYQNKGKKKSDGSEIQDTSKAAGLGDQDFDVWDQAGQLLVGGTDYTVVEGADGVYTIDATSAGMTSGQARARSTSAPLVKSNIVDVQP